MEVFFRQALGRLIMYRRLLPVQQIYSAETTKPPLASFLGALFLLQRHFFLAP
jgi:hypothetical protein